MEIKIGEDQRIQNVLFNPRHVVVLRNGVEVGVVSALYDFSKLPAIFHPFAAAACSTEISLHCNVPLTIEELEADRAKVEAILEWEAKPWWWKLWHTLRTAWKSWRS